MISNDINKYPVFTGENVPVRVAAKIMKKDQQYIRLGLVKKIFPFGEAFKMPGSSHYNYYISPKKFYEFTGYIYNPDDKE